MQETVSMVPTVETMKLESVILSAVVHDLQESQHLC